MAFSLPIFQPDQLTYVPWKPATNDTTFQLHYQSLAVLPPLSFDNKILRNLDTLYSQLDGELTTKLHDGRKNIAKIQPATTSTLSDVFTYLAFSLTFLHSLIFIILFCCHRRCFSSANAAATIPMYSARTPLQRQLRCSHTTDGDTL